MDLITEEERLKLDKFYFDAMFNIKEVQRPLKEEHTELLNELFYTVCIENNFRVKEQLLNVLGKSKYTHFERCEDEYDKSNLKYKTRLRLASMLNIDFTSKCSVDLSFVEDLTLEEKQVLYEEGVENGRVREQIKFKKEDYLMALQEKKIKVDKTVKLNELIELCKKEKIFLKPRTALENHPFKKKVEKVELNDKNLKNMFKKLVFNFYGGEIKRGERRQVQVDGLRKEVESLVYEPNKFLQLFK